MGINCKNVLLFFIYFPIIACAVQLWIHWQALKVYCKGVANQRHPRNKYVNPFTFWMKHTFIFCVATLSLVWSFAVDIVKKVLGKSNVNKSECETRRELDE